VGGLKTGKKWDQDAGFAAFATYASEYNPIPMSLKVNEPKVKKWEPTLRQKDAAEREPLDVGQHGGVDAFSAEVYAMADQLGAHPERILRKIVEKYGSDQDKEILAVIGQEYDRDPDKPKEIVGVLVAPVLYAPLVYAKNSSVNLGAAILKRLVAKARPVTATKEDYQKVGKFINAAMYGPDAVWSMEKVQEWITTELHLCKLVSGKWTLSRALRSIEQAYQQVEPEFKMAAALKLEPMPEGKPPRFLIADGDSGQLFSLIVVKCFEDLLYKRFKPKSIKGRSKREAIQDGIKALTRHKAALIEGDGSAWDTTCSEKVRDAVENPILTHIAAIMCTHGVVPQQWHQAHLDACAGGTLKLFFKSHLGAVRATISAIRRSGHRGTSCLNWWVNFTMWVCSIFRAPEGFLRCEARMAYDVTGANEGRGTKRWWNGIFEGDDSLCALFPAIQRGDELYTKFIGWWERWGFNMVLKFCQEAECKGRATFAGYNIAVKRDGSCAEAYLPELSRALLQGGTSVSGSAREAFRKGDVKTVKSIAYAAAIARAADFAGLLPFVSMKYYNYAQSLRPEKLEACVAGTETWEASMRHFGEGGHSLSEIEVDILKQNVEGDLPSEISRLRQLGFVQTDAELEAFRGYEWSFDRLGDFEGYALSIPASWK